MVRAETLRSAQSDRKNASGSAMFVVKAEILQSLRSFRMTCLGGKGG